MVSKQSDANQPLIDAADQVQLYDHADVGSPPIGLHCSPQSPYVPSSTENPIERSSDYELHDIEHPTSEFVHQFSGDSHGGVTTSQHGQQQQPVGAATQFNNIPSQDPSDAQEWISSWLQPRTLLSIAALTVIITAAVIGLLVANKLHKGIAFVDLEKREGPQLIPDLRIGIGLSWTFVPVLIFQMYGLLITGVIEAALDRQPYVELNREPGSLGAPAERSICLEYRSYWAPFAIVKAWQLSHYTLLSGMCLSAVVKILLAAISAHLFFTNPMTVRKSIDLHQASTFDYDGFNGNSSLTPVLDVVAATRVYGGRPISWTTLNESLIPLSLEQALPTSSLTVNTMAMSAAADCVLLPPDQFIMTASDNGLEFSLEDRNCNITSQLFTPRVYPRVRDYVQTYTYSTCSSAYNSSRIVAIAAHNANASDQVLTNIFGVSCIPVYFQYSTNATLDTSDISPVEVRNTSSDKMNLLDERPSFALLFEREINQAGTIDPSSPIYATNFGRIISQYSASTSNLSYIDGETMRIAVQDLFTTAFAVMANKFLISESAPQIVQASYYQPKTRVYVVPPVGCTILGILAVILGFLWRIYTYTRSRPSVLYEEPIGLLGAAAILRKSDLLGDVTQIAAHSSNGKVATDFQTALASSRDLDVDPGGWALDAWEKPSDARLVKTQQSWRLRANGRG